MGFRVELGFFLQVKNIGSQNDTYELLIQTLSSDFELTIYSDINGNGIIGSEDVVITKTALLVPNQVYPIIIKLRDKTGLPNGTKVDFNLVATSIADNTIHAFSPFSVNIKPQLAVGLTSPLKIKTVQPKTSWTFQGIVKNIGVDTDSYALSLTGIPTGVTAFIYSDSNGNGIRDLGDNIISTTNNLPANVTFPVIISITDDIGLPNGTKIDANLTATSLKDSLIKASILLTTNVNYNPTSGPTSLSTPVPTSSSLTPNIRIQKTGFPNGRVKVGDDLSYYIEIFNESQINTKKLYLKDKIPSGLIVLNDSKNGFITASDNGKIEFSYDGNNWIENYTPCETSKDCIKYIRIGWDSIAPNQKFDVYFKTKVDGYVDGAINNIAWAELPEYKKTDVPTITPTNKIFSNETNNVVANEIYVKGTLYTKTGDPREKVVVELYDKTGKKVGETVTGKTGYFEIPVDKKDEYNIVYKLENSDKSYKDVVTVDKVGYNDVPIHVSGKVRDSQTEKIIPNSKVELIDDKGNVINSGVTDENGEYLFDRTSDGKLIKSGEYTLAVTQANGHVTYVKVIINAESGDVVIAEDLLVDPFGIVYDEYGGEDIRINGAQVKLVTDCNDPSSTIKLDTLSVNQKQDNPFITGKDGTYQFFLNKEQLNNKDYCLMVSAEGYYSRIFAVRLMPVQTEGTLDVNGVKKKVYSKKYVAIIKDDRGKTTTIANIESLPYAIALKPINKIELNKKANKPVIEIGDVETYTIDLTNKLKFKLRDSVLSDLLPKGFKYVQGSLIVDGKYVRDYKAMDKLSIKIGDLDPEKKHTVLYQAIAGLNVEAGSAINNVDVIAKTPINSDIKEGPAQATVVVKKGVFSKNGSIIGRVLVEGDQNLANNIAIYTSNGLRILTDSKGKYSIQDLPNGSFVLHIDKDSLPKNVYLPEEAYTLIEEKNKKINDLVSEKINVDNTSNLIYLTDKGFTFVSSKNQVALADEFPTIAKNMDKITLTNEKGKEYNIELGKKYLPQDFALNKSANKYLLKVTDADGKLLNQKKLVFWYLPAQKQVEKAKWIGDNDILKRVFIPESGLVKANFNLVQVNPLELPEKLAKDSNSLMAVYVYPAKFTTKEIPYITYPDIKDHWAKNVVEYESGLEIIHGYPDGNFKPARNITRSEATKLTLVALKSFDVKMSTNFVYNLAKPSKITLKVFDKENKVVYNFYENKPRKEGTHIINWDGRNEEGKLQPVGKYRFELISKDKDENIETLSTNVDIIGALGNYRPVGKSIYKDLENHWASSFVKVATDEKLIDGYADGNFRPDGIISRYEMAIMAVKALKLDLKTAKDTLTFKDAEDIPQEAKKYVYLADKNNVLPKFADNKFRPYRPISRAEIAVFVKNLISQQKIQSLLRGSTNSTANIIFENKKIPLNKDNTFELPLDKSALDIINLLINGAENKIYLDDNYKTKSVFEKVADGSNIMPVPEVEISVEEFDKLASSDTDKEKINTRVIVDLSEKEDKKYVLDYPNTALSITAEEALTPKVLINGKEADSKRIGKTDFYKDTGLTTFTYYGLSLEVGKNELEGYFVDQFGNIRGDKLQKTVFVKGIPSKITIAQNKIPADGKSIGEITIIATDKYGNPAIDDAKLAVRVSQGEIKSLDQDENKTGHQVRIKDGKATIKVLSPNGAQTAKIAVDYADDLKIEEKIEYSVPLREPIFVGMGNAGSGYNFSTKKDQSSPNLDPVDKTGFISNIGASLFTQGTIFDEYLLTFALDTTKKLNEKDYQRNVLFRDRAEERTYPIYGDSSQLSQVASSNSNVFLKLEKEKSSLLWGDFTTSSGSMENESNSARLALYSRALTGGKLALNLPESTNLDLFGATSTQSNTREQISANGLSSYYLQKYPIVSGTERIMVETRKRETENISKTPLKTTYMTNIIDYSIDYSTGIITFSQPIPSYDKDLNPNYIIVLYDHYKSESANSVAGINIKQQLPLGASIGGSFVNELLDQGKPYRIWGVNLSEKINSSFDIMGEYANSYFENKYGSAYRLSLISKPWDTISLNAEYQRADKSFDNRTGASVTPNSERYNARGDYKPFSTTSIQLDYSRDNNFDTNSLLQTGKLNAIQDVLGNSFNLALEGRNFPNPTDPIKDSSKNLNAALITLGYRTPTFYGIALNIGRDQNLLTSIDNTKPTATNFGADYTLPNGMKLFAKESIFEKDAIFQNSKKIKDKELIFAHSLGLDTTFSNKDWDYFNNNTLSTKYQIDGAIDGRSAQHLLGLNNRLNVTSDLFLGLSYERVMFDKTNPTRTLLNIDDDHNSTSVSVEYLPKNLGVKSSARYEIRDGKNPTNLISLNSAGAIGDDFGLFGRFMLMNNPNDVARPNSTDGLFGLAYRPLSHDYFNGFLKYEIKNKTEGQGVSANVFSNIFSFEGIIQPDSTWDINTKFALKNTLDIVDLSKILVDSENPKTKQTQSNIILGMTRVTYRFLYNFDVASQLRSEWQPETNQLKNDLALEMGYYPIKDFRVGIGYNFMGANDFDKDLINNTGYTAQGPYISVNFKVGQIWNIWGQNGEITKKDLINQQVSEK